MNNDGKAKQWQPIRFGYDEDEDDIVKQAKQKAAENIVLKKTTNIDNASANTAIDAAQVTGKTPTQPVQEPVQSYSELATAAETFDAITKEYGSYSDYVKQYGVIDKYSVESQEYLKTEERSKRYNKVLNGEMSEDTFLMQEYGYDYLAASGHDISSPGYWYDKILKNDMTSPISNKYLIASALKYAEEAKTLDDYTTAVLSYNAATSDLVNEAVKKNSKGLNEDLSFDQAKDFLSKLNIDDANRYKEMLKHYKAFGTLSLSESDIKEGVIEEYRAKLGTDASTEDILKAIANEATLIRDKDNKVIGYWGRDGDLHEVKEEGGEGWFKDGVYHVEYVKDKDGNPTTEVKSLVDTNGIQVTLQSVISGLASIVTDVVSLGSAAVGAIVDLGNMAFNEGKFGKYTGKFYASTTAWMNDAPIFETIMDTGYVDMDSKTSFLDVTTTAGYIGGVIAGMFVTAGIGAAIKGGAAVGAKATSAAVTAGVKQGVQELNEQAVKQAAKTILQNSADDIAETAVKKVLSEGAEEAAKKTLGSRVRNITGDVLIRGSQIYTGAGESSSGVVARTLAKSNTSRLFGRIGMEAALSHGKTVGVYFAKDFLDNIGYQYGRYEYDPTFRARYSGAKEAELFTNALKAAAFNAGISLIFAGGKDDSPTRRLVSYFKGPGKEGANIAKNIARYSGVLGAGNKKNRLAIAAFDTVSDFIDNIVTMKVSQAFKQDGDISLENVWNEMVKFDQTTVLSGIMALFTGSGSLNRGISTISETYSKGIPEMDAYLTKLSMDKNLDPSAKEALTIAIETANGNRQKVLSGEVKVAAGEDGIDRYEDLDLIDATEPNKKLASVGIQSKIAADVVYAETLFQMLSGTKAVGELSNILKTANNNVRLDLNRQILEYAAAEIKATRASGSKISKHIMTRGLNSLTELFDRKTLKFLNNLDSVSNTKISTGLLDIYGTLTEADANITAAAEKELGYAIFETTVKPVSINSEGWKELPEDIKSLSNFEVFEITTGNTKNNMQDTAIKAAKLLSEDIGSEMSIKYVATEDGKHYIAIKDLGATKNVESVSKLASFSKGSELLKKLTFDIETLKTDAEDKRLAVSVFDSLIKVLYNDQNLDLGDEDALRRNTTAAVSTLEKLVKEDIIDKKVAIEILSAYAAAEGKIDRKVLDDEDGLGKTQLVRGFLLKEDISKLITAINAFDSNQSEDTRHIDAIKADIRDLVGSKMLKGEDISYMFGDIDKGVLDKLLKFINDKTKNLPLSVLQQLHESNYTTQFKLSKDIKLLTNEFFNYKGTKSAQFSKESIPNSGSYILRIDALIPKELRRLSNQFNAMIVTSGISESDAIGSIKETTSPLLKSQLAMCEEIKEGAAKTKTSFLVFDRVADNKELLYIAHRLGYKDINDLLKTGSLYYLPDNSRSIKLKINKQGLKDFVNVIKSTKADRETRILDIQNALKNLQYVDDDTKVFFDGSPMSLLGFLDNPELGSEDAKMFKTYLKEKTKTNVQGGATVESVANLIVTGKKIKGTVNQEIKDALFAKWLLSQFETIKEDVVISSEDLLTIKEDFGSSEMSFKELKRLFKDTAYDLIEENGYYRISINPSKKIKLLAKVKNGKEVPIRSFFPILGDLKSGKTATATAYSVSKSLAGSYDLDDEDVNSLVKKMISQGQSISIDPKIFDETVIPTFNDYVSLNSIGEKVDELLKTHEKNIYLRSLKNIITLLKQDSKLMTNTESAGTKAILSDSSSISILLNKELNDEAALKEIKSLYSEKPKITPEKKLIFNDRPYIGDVYLNKSEGIILINDFSKVTVEDIAEARNIIQGFSKEQIDANDRLEFNSIAWLDKLIDNDGNLIIPENILSKLSLDDYDNIIKLLDEENKKKFTDAVNMFHKDDVTKIPRKFQEEKARKILHNIDAPSISTTTSGVRQVGEMTKNNIDSFALNRYYNDILRSFNRELQSSPISAFYRNLTADEANTMSKKLQTILDRVISDEVNTSTRTTYDLSSENGVYFAMQDIEDNVSQLIGLYDSQFGGGITEYRDITNENRDKISVEEFNLNNTRGNIIRNLIESAAEITFSRHGGRTVSGSSKYFILDKSGKITKRIESSYGDKALLQDFAGKRENKLLGLNELQNEYRDKAFLLAEDDDIKYKNDSTIKGTVLTDDMIHKMRNESIARLTTSDWDTLREIDSEKANEMFKSSLELPGSYKQSFNNILKGPAFRNFKAIGIYKNGIPNNGFDSSENIFIALNEALIGKKPESGGLIDSILGTVYTGVELTNRQYQSFKNRLMYAARNVTNYSGSEDIAENKKISKLLQGFYKEINSDVSKETFKVAYDNLITTLEEAGLEEEKISSISDSAAKLAAIAIINKNKDNKFAQRLVFSDDSLVGKKKSKPIDLDSEYIDIDTETLFKLGAFQVGYTRFKISDSYDTDIIESTSKFIRRPNKTEIENIKQIQDGRILEGDWKEISEYAKENVGYKDALVEWSKATDNDIISRQEFEGLISSGNLVGHNVKASDVTEWKKIGLLSKDFSIENIYDTLELINDFNIKVGDFGVGRSQEYIIAAIKVLQDYAKDGYRAHNALDDSIMNARIFAYIAKYANIDETKKLRTEFSDEFVSLMSGIKQSGKGMAYLQNEVLGSLRKTLQDVYRVDAPFTDLDIRTRLNVLQSMWKTSLANEYRRGIRDEISSNIRLKSKAVEGIKNGSAISFNKLFATVVNHTEGASIKIKLEAADSIISKALKESNKKDLSANEVINLLLSNPLEDSFINTLATKLNVDVGTFKEELNKTNIDPETGAVISSYESSLNEHINGGAYIGYLTRQTKDAVSSNFKNKDLITNDIVKELLTMFIDNENINAVPGIRYSYESDQAADLKDLLERTGKKLPVEGIHKTVTDQDRELRLKISDVVENPSSDNSTAEISKDWAKSLNITKDGQMIAVTGHPSVVPGGSMLLLKVKILDIKGKSVFRVSPSVLTSIQRDTDGDGLTIYKFDSDAESKCMRGIQSLLYGETDKELNDVMPIADTIWIKHSNEFPASVETADKIDSTRAVNIFYSSERYISRDKIDSAIEEINSAKTTAKKLNIIESYTKGKLKSLFDVTLSSAEKGPDGKPLQKTINVFDSIIRLANKNIGGENSYVAFETGMSKISSGSKAFVASQKVTKSYGLIDTQYYGMLNKALNPSVDSNVKLSDYDRVYVTLSSEQKNLLKNALWYAIKNPDAYPELLNKFDITNASELSNLSDEAIVSKANDKIDAFDKKLKALQDNAYMSEESQNKFRDIIEEYISSDDHSENYRRLENLQTLYEISKEVGNDNPVYASLTNSRSFDEDVLIKYVIDSSHAGDLVSDKYEDLSRISFLVPADANSVWPYSEDATIANSYLDDTLEFKASERSAYKLSKDQKSKLNKLKKDYDSAVLQLSKLSKDKDEKSAKRKIKSAQSEINLFIEDVIKREDLNKYNYYLVNGGVDSDNFYLILEEYKNISSAKTGAIKAMSDITKEVPTPFIDILKNNTDVSMIISQDLLAKKQSQGMDVHLDKTIMDSSGRKFSKYSMPAAITLSDKSFNQYKLDSNLSSSGQIQDILDSTYGVAIFGGLVYKINEDGTISKDATPVVEALQSLRDINRSEGYHPDNFLPKLRKLQILSIYDVISDPSNKFDLTNLVTKDLDIDTINKLMSPEFINRLKGLGTYEGHGMLNWYKEQLVKLYTSNQNKKATFESILEEDGFERYRSLFDQKLEDSIKERTVADPELGKDIEESTSKALTKLRRVVGRQLPGGDQPYLKNAVRGFLSAQDFFKHAFNINLHRKKLEDAQLLGLLPTIKGLTSSITDGFESVAHNDNELISAGGIGELTTNKAGLVSSINKPGVIELFDENRINIPDDNSQKKISQLSHEDFIRSELGVEKDQDRYKAIRPIIGIAKNLQSVENKFSPVAVDNAFKPSTISKEIDTTELTLDVSTRGIEYKINAESKDIEEEFNKGQEMDYRSFNKFDTDFTENNFYNLISEAVPFNEAIKLSNEIKNNNINNIVELSKKNLTTEAFSFADSNTLKELNTLTSPNKTILNLLGDIKSVRVSGDKEAINTNFIKSILQTVGFKGNTINAKQFTNVDLPQALKAGQRITASIESNILVLSKILSDKRNENLNKEFVTYTHAKRLEVLLKHGDAESKDVKMLSDFLGIKNKEDLSKVIGEFEIANKPIVDLYNNLTNNIIGLAKNLSITTEQPINSLSLYLTPYISIDKSEKTSQFRSTIKNFKLLDLTEQDLFKNNTGEDFINGAMVLTRDLQKAATAAAIKDRLIADKLIDNDSILKALELSYEEFAEIAVKSDLSNMSYDDISHIGGLVRSIVDTEYSSKIPELIKSSYSGKGTAVDHYIGLYKAIDNQLANSKEFGHMSTDDLKIKIRDLQSKNMRTDALQKILDLKELKAGMLIDLIQSDKDAVDIMFNKIVGATAGFGDRATLVDSYNREIKQGVYFKKLYDSSLEDVSKNVKYHYDSDTTKYKLAVIMEALTGNVFVGNKELATLLDKNIYVKHTPRYLAALQKMGQTAITGIMSNPLKLFSRMITYSFTDLSIAEAISPTSIFKLPRAMKMLSAYVLSNGKNVSPELQAYLQQKGNDLVGAKERDIITRSVQDMKTSSKGGPIKKYTNTVKQFFDVQSDAIRFLIFLDARERFNSGKESSYRYGSAYHNKEMIDSLTDLSAEEAKSLGYLDGSGDGIAISSADRKAYQVVVEALGNPGDFPIIAQKLNGYLVFNTFPAAFVRTTKGFGSSLKKAVEMAVRESDYKGMYQFVIPSLLGLGGTTAIYSLLVSAIADMFGMEEEDEEEILKEQRTLDPFGSILTGGPVFNYDSHNPMMILNSMFIKPITDEIEQAKKYGEKVSLKDIVERYATSQVLSKINPFIKTVGEVATNTDMIGTDQIDTRYDYTIMQNIVRKISGLFIGTTLSKALVDAYSIKDYSDDPLMAQLAKAAKTGILNELGNSKTYKRDKNNYYRSKSWLAAQKAIENDLRFDGLDYTSLFDGKLAEQLYTSDYDKNDYNTLSKRFDKALRLGKEPSEIYEMIFTAIKDDHMSVGTVNAVLNNKSVIRKLEGLKDKNGFLTSLSDKQRRQLSEAIAWEEKNLPGLADIKLYKDYQNNYVPKNYVSSHPIYIKTPYIKKPYTPYKKPIFQTSNYSNDTFGVSSKMGVWDKKNWTSPIQTTKTTKKNNYYKKR